MQITQLLLVFTAAAFARAANPPNTLSDDEKREGYVLLFNGKDLTRWDGDPQLWTVQDGAVTGSTDGRAIQHNTFLIYRDKYANFVLQADIKLRNHNSGIQFRSQRQPEWVVTGYQADASEAGPEKSAWGNLYDEKGRARALMRTPDEGWLKAKSIVRHGDWNHYEIIANGHHLALRLNGLETINQEVEKTTPGVIAIQLHMGEPMQVQIRNIKLKVLK